MEKIIKNLTPYFFIALLLFGVISISQGPAKKETSTTLNTLVTQINDGKVKSITVEGNQLAIELQDGSKQKAQKESEASLTETLANYNVNNEKLSQVNINIKEPSGF